MRKFIEIACVLGVLILVLYLLFGRLDRTKYDVQCKNSCDGEISDVVVKYNNFVYGPISIKAQGKGLYYMRADTQSPIPDKANVEWSTPDNVKHSQTVEVKNKINADRQRLTLIFTITPSNEVVLSTD